MLAPALNADLALLRSAALEAGELALTFFRRNPNAWSKAGGSPVTEADMAVDAFLRQSLLAARPDYGWLSEETVDDVALRCAKDTIFVVDPIDGTRGFIAGDERWCVSVAIVRDRRPVAGALYAPARGELLTAAAGEGAFMGGRRLAVAEASSSLEGAGLAGPRGWLRTAAIRNTGACIEEHVPSLAYRFALVAMARVEAAFASPRANDWDLAACDLLVHEAGGRLVGLDGASPRYNGETPRHGALVAGNGALLEALLPVVDAAAREVARGGAGSAGKPR